MSADFYPFLSFVDHFKPGDTFSAVGHRYEVLHVLATHLTIRDIDAGSKHVISINDAVAMGLFDGCGRLKRKAEEMGFVWRESIDE